MILMVAISAFAAEVTTMPPAMGIAPEVRYAMTSSRGKLQEAGQPIGRLDATVHQVSGFVGVGLAKAFAVGLGVDYTARFRHRWPSTPAMAVEPLDGSGSYLAGPAIDTSIEGSGLNAIWLELSAAPFRGQASPSEWKLDAAVRLPANGSSKYTSKDDSDKRGGSDGPMAIRLRGAMAYQQGWSTPYVRSELLIGLPGDIGEPAVRVQTPLLATIAGGFELSAATEQRKLGLGLEGWASFRSWSDGVSGLYLPNVLPAGTTVPMTSSEGIVGGANLALFGRSGPGTLTLTTGLSWQSPWRPEHLYDVTITEENRTLHLALRGGGRFSFNDP